MTKKILLIIGVLILIMVLAVGALIYIGYNQFKEMEKGDVEFSGNKLQTLPFRYSHSGHIVIDVNINGKYYPFMIDTGASGFIFDHFIDQFDLTRSGFSISRSPNDDFSLNPIHVLPEFKINNIKFTQIRFKTSEFEVDCLENIVGLIGKEAMRHLVWQFDFSNNLIHISQKLSHQTIGKSAYKLSVYVKKKSHHIRANIKSGNALTSALVDLGYSGTLTLPKNHFLKDSADYHVVEGCGLQGGTLGSENNEVISDNIYLFDSINIGDKILYDLPVYVKEGGFAMLGLGFLEKFKVTFSWNDNSVYLEEADDLTFVARAFGFNMRYDEENERAFVSHLTKGLTAIENDIQLFDQILSINEFDVSDKSEYCHIKHLISDLDTLQINTIRDGVMRNNIL